MFLDDPSQITMVVIDHIGLIETNYLINLPRNKLLIKCLMNSDLLETSMDIVTCSG